MHHQIIVLGMFAHVRIIAQTHFKIESVHRNGVLQESFYLLKHAQQKLIVQLELLDYIVRLAVIDIVSSKLY